MVMYKTFIIIIIILSTIQINYDLSLASKCTSIKSARDFETDFTGFGTWPSL